jgi:hypothetical protein
VSGLRRRVRQAPGATVVASSDREREEEHSGRRPRGLHATRRDGRRGRHGRERDPRVTPRTSTRGATATRIRDADLRE